MLDGIGFDSSSGPCEGSVIGPCVQTWKLRHREVTSPTPGHTAAERPRQDSSQGLRPRCPLSEGRELSCLRAWLSTGAWHRWMQLVLLSRARRQLIHQTVGLLCAATNPWQWGWGHAFGLENRVPTLSPGHPQGLFWLSLGCSWGQTALGAFLPPTGETGIWGASPRALPRVHDCLSKLPVPKSESGPCFTFIKRPPRGLHELAFQWMRRGDPGGINTVSRTG